jgi:hypothetical protein
MGAISERELAHARERMCPLPNLPRRMRKWCERMDAQEQPPPLSQGGSQNSTRHNG